MHRLLPLVVLALVALATARTVMPAAAGGATLGVSPASQTVDDNQTFSVAIVQDAPVVTTGAQTDITFNPALLQVVSVDKGAAYDTASLVIGVAPQTAAQAIAEANNTGTLQNVSAFYLPGAGSVTAGPTTFVTVNMQAKTTGGVSPIGLSGVEMLDAGGDTIAVTTNDGEVTVDAPLPTPTPKGQTPTPTPEPTPTPSPTPVPTPTPEPDAFMKIAPPSLAVRPGTTFSVSITQSANFVTTGAGADFSFNAGLLQVTAVERGPDYRKASLIYGVVPQTNAEAVAEANVTGQLKNLATFFIPGTGSVQPGETTFLKITMKAGGAEGTSPITISNSDPELEMLNEQGESLVVAGTDGVVVVDVDAPVAAATQTPSTLPAGGGQAGLSSNLWVVLAFAGLLGLAGVVAVHTARKPGPARDRRSPDQPAPVNP